jgi:hypothetical protein
MKRTSDAVDPNRRRRRRALALSCGVFATLLLGAAVAAAPAAGLLERLFSGKAAPRTEAPSQGDAALATVRLTVEGMVCYG